MNIFLQFIYLSHTLSFSTGLFSLNQTALILYFIHLGFGDKQWLKIVVKKKKSKIIFA